MFLLPNVPARGPNDELLLLSGSSLWLEEGGGRRGAGEETCFDFAELSVQDFLSACLVYAQGSVWEQGSNTISQIKV